MSTTQRFSGKVALVTGGGAGIGEATVLAFAAEGASVVLLERDAEAAAAVAERVRAEGGRAVAVVGDVRVSADCERAVAAATGELGGLDIVFCNAGVFAPGTAETQTEEEWDTQIDILLKGTFLTCKHAIPALRQRGGGCIILSGSNCSHIGCSGRFAYTAAKAAMPVLAKQISNDYYHSARIRANCVSPGYVQTRMTEEIWRRQTNAEPGTPVPATLTAGWQSAAAITSTVLFLASDDAADIAGVTIPVSRTALLRVAAQRMA